MPEEGLPKLLAFDLDATLWYPELYMLSRGAPFTPDGAGGLRDASGERMRLMVRPPCRLCLCAAAAAAAPNAIPQG